MDRQNIQIRIDDEFQFNDRKDHNPRLYNLAKKLYYFVKYLNKNYDYLFFEYRGAGGFNIERGELKEGQKPEMMITCNGLPLEIDQRFIQQETFSEFDFKNFAPQLISELERKGLTVPRNQMRFY
jgi:hypothetical protein